jgi:hypothetical protein
MVRRLFGLLSALSLLLCVGTCALWVRSKWDRNPQFDNWTFTTADSEYLVVVHSGRFFIDRQPSEHYDVTGFLEDFKGWTHHGLDPNLSRSSLWFGYGEFVTKTGTIAWAIAVPCWSMAGIFSVLPAIWIKRHWWRRGRIPGMCRRCGYDLRATLDQCPECGAMPEAKV